MDNVRDSFNIYSLNARGLGDKKKRQAVFTWLNEKEPGIFLIQESHSLKKRVSGDLCGMVRLNSLMVLPITGE